MANLSQIRKALFPKPYNHPSELCHVSEFGVGNVQPRNTKFPTPVLGLEINPGCFGVGSLVGMTSILFFLLFSNSNSRSTGEKSIGKWKMEKHFWYSEIAIGIKALEGTNHQC